MDSSIDDYFKNQISNCKGDQRKLFGTVDNVLGKKNVALPQSSSDLETANNFLLFFKNKIDNICQKLPPVNVSTLDTVNCTSQSFQSFTPICCDMLKKIILGAPKSMCPLDPIPTRLIIDGIDLYLPFLYHVINLSLTSGTFPDCFKNALVKPLIKKSTLDPDVLKNYRPVSNLPFLSKIVERVVASQIQQHMDDHSLHNPLQSAYRTGHSCETAVLKVQNDILCALDEGYVVVHVMLDLSAAFDTLDHNILLNRLKTKIGVNGIAYKWFKSYLTNRTQQVIINGKVSSKSQLNIGVPQGSVLGPVLFNVYTLPLYELARENDVFGGFYADDSQLYVICKVDMIETSYHILENAIHEFMSWMSVNRLKLNGDKTELTVFSKPRIDVKIRPMLPCLNIDSAQIAPQSQCRILGSFFDSVMSMDVHVSQFCKSANYHLHNVYSIRKYLDPKTTESLVHAYLTSRLDYCNSLLVGITKRNLSRLQKVQNRAARLCLGIPKYARISNLSLLQSLHWLPVSYRIDFKILLFTFKCIHDLAPTYLTELINVRTIGRTLRSTESVLLDVPRSNTKTFGERAFASAAPRLWNSLPVSLRSIDSLSLFKQSLKTHLFREAF